MSTFKEFFEAFDSDSKNLKKNRGSYDSGSKKARGYKFKKKSKQNIAKSQKQNLKDKGYRKSKTRSNRTGSAREILAKKHGYKKALARVDGKYVLDHEQVNDLMDRIGFVFDDVGGKWKSSPKINPEDGRKGKPKEKEIKSTDEIEKDKETLDDLQNKSPKDPELALDKQEIDNPPNDFQSFFSDEENEDMDVEELEDEEWYTDLFTKGKDNEIFHITEREVMIFQARFLLALIWEEYAYTEYELTENGELWGVMSRRDAIRAMQALELEWDELNNVWVDKDGAEVFRYRTDHEDLKKSIIGRALLANMNFLNYIQFNNDENKNNVKPLMHPDSVRDQMEEQDFHWNDSEEIWEYIGEDHRADYGSLNHERGK